jgi:glycosyltransferase involved in cell wall biosynthesis
MKILHTESSNGWGGQEMRILREAEGMRSRGHEIVFAVVRGGKLVAEARKKGFTVYEIDFNRWKAAWAIGCLLRIIQRHQIDIVNTHSSLDAWLGAIAARIGRKKIVRTRHLSTNIRKGLNSRILYNSFADVVVTTSSMIVPVICEQAGISSSRCFCVPTGVEAIEVVKEDVKLFRESLGVGRNDFLIGTACVVRSWKGIQDLMRAAEMLKSHSNIRWVIVGGGYLDQYRDLIDLKNILTFTGHLENPHIPIRAMDVFTLLSTAHEGISQAALQAAYQMRPLITTPIGGLPEVCIDGATGLHVPPHSPEKVAQAVLKLIENPSMRERFGKAGRALVEENFMMEHTLNQMEKVYANL